RAAAAAKDILEKVHQKIHIFSDDRQRQRKRYLTKDESECISAIKYIRTHLNCLLIIIRNALRRQPAARTGGGGDRIARRAAAGALAAGLTGLRERAHKL